MDSSTPGGRWVLHATPLLGGVTDRWIDLQSRLAGRYESRLLGGGVAEGASRRSHWLVADEHADTRLAWRLMEKSRGATGLWLARCLRGNGPAVVHGHYGTFAAQLRQFSRCLGAPLVASFYGYDATKTEIRTHPRWRRQYRQLFEEAAAVIVEGPAMASRVAALGCPAKRLHVVRMPADADGLELCRRPKADSFLVVAAGRFIEKKGFDTAISAFARALKGKDARLMIIGGGELEGSLRALVGSEGIDEQVVWSGRLPFADFMAAVSTAHLGLYPSRTAGSGDSEGGAPVTLIEAQWLGVPSIVSDHDDLGFVSAPDGALVLPARDVGAWAEAIEAVYEDRTRLERMSRAAGRFARENHAPARNLAEREAVYRAVGG